MSEPGTVSLPETPSDRFRSGFVSILGRPNVGKSTLLNALTRARLAIVSDKPQTTRTLIQGVLTLPHAQIVFLDTPGIHEPDTVFNRRMMETVRKALEERDLLLYVVEATEPVSDEEREDIEMVLATGTPAFLVINKIDRLRDKSRLLPLIDEYRQLGDFAEFVPVSALRGDGLERLQELIVQRLPEGPAYFPPDYLTDQPERFLAGELIREKILHLTRQEVPHAVAVMVDRWEETPNLLRISATIYVEKEGQKAIVIGAGGQLLKKVGTAARQEMEALFGRKVFLELFVKVRPRWREDPRFLAELDWRSMVGKVED
ncbi:MAG: GTPase Era [Bryobacterales bacterium]|nr:GTPase Era [Bryobacteraceae bacterium]MDW8129104.1 GTPase Era [Bryobacterales bacterium]